MARKKQSRSAGASTPKSVRFTTQVPEAHEVVVTGDFVGWKPEGIPLEKGPDGAWSATLNLPPGEYQYRLRVDGDWRDDPRAVRRIANAYGSENGVLVVG